MKFSVKDIDRLRYRPLKTAEEFLGELRTSLGLNDKATGARLALGRSITEPISPGELETYAASTEKGMPIEGIHLFGDDADVWGCLIASTAKAPVNESSSFRTLVEFHWSRGAKFLQSDFSAANRNNVDFIVQLSGRVAKSERLNVSVGVGRGGTPRRPISELVRVNIVDGILAWEMNAAGGNGLMVISGRPGSGKSQLALDMLAQAARQGVRFLFFDLKGELEESADNPAQAQKRESFLSATSAEYSRLIQSKLPINPFFLGANPAETAQISSEFASLVRCFASQLGANQERVIREVYEELPSPDISGLVNTLRERGEEGVALSVFDKIASFEIFSNAQDAIPIEDWLSKSRVIDFKGLGNDSETKALIVAFVLNTIMRKLNRQLPVSNGVQPLQMILFVDEAHLLLPKEGKAGLLGSLARQGRAWGFPVWLASQDADAFITTGQHATDFAELADCGIHLSPSILNDSQQRQILGQVIHKKLGEGEGVLRLRGTTTVGKIRQFWRDAGDIPQTLPK